MINHWSSKPPKRKSLGVVQKIFEPLLNADCLCGSGFKYKRCCQKDVEHTDRYERFPAPENGNDYKLNLLTTRRRITKYIILHKTTTAPLLPTENEAVLNLLAIDIRAMSELVQNLLYWYSKIGDLEKFIQDCERLRVCINDSHWLRKVTYFQIIASLGEEDDWDRALGKKELIKLLPMDDEIDPDILQLYLHFFEDELFFSKKIHFSEKIINNTKSDSEKLQYRIYKAIQFLLIGEVQPAISEISIAISEYEKSPEFKKTAFGRRKFADSLQLIGELSKSKTHTLNAITEYNSILESDDWPPSTHQDIYFQLGKCFFDIEKYEDSLEQYDKSLELKYSQLPLIFKAQAYLRLGNKTAKKLISEIKLDNLTSVETLDYIFTYALIALEFRDREMTEKSVDLLGSAPVVDPIFERQRSVIISRVAALIRDNNFSNRKSILKTLKLLLKDKARYLLLQPNIAGVGININKIINDLDIDGK